MKGIIEGAKPARPVIAGEQIDAALDAVEERHRFRLDRLTHTEIARQGWTGVRQGGRVWERCQRDVIANLIANGMTVADVEDDFDEMRAIAEFEEKEEKRALKSGRVQVTVTVAPEAELAEAA